MLIGDNGQLKGTGGDPELPKGGSGLRDSEPEDLNDNRFRDKEPGAAGFRDREPGATGFRDREPGHDYSKNGNSFRERVPGPPPKTTQSPYLLGVTRGKGFSMGVTRAPRPQNGGGGGFRGKKRRFNR